MAEKKSKPKPAATGNGTIEDVDHEVVHTTELNAAAAAANPEEQIKIEISKFTYRDAAISQLKEKYGGLTIAGPDDKENYKAVREAWGEVRTIRTGLEKKGLELRNRYKVITSAISKEEDRLIDLVTPLENDLYQKWKAIDEEKERVRREQEEAEQRKAMERVEAVLGMGMEFKDGFYVIGDVISMDVATLRALPEDKFAAFTEKVKAAAAKIRQEQEAAAEKKRLEAEDLKRQQDELKRQQDEIAKQQRELREQQEQLAREQEAARKDRLNLRLKKFMDYGMVQNGNELIYDSGYDTVTLFVEDVEHAEEFNFADLLKQTREAINQLNDRRDHLDNLKAEEQKKREEKEKMVAECMQAAGFNYSYTARAFTFENDIDAFSQPFDELLQLTDEQVEVKAAEWSKKRAESIKRSAEIKAARVAEEKKQERLAMGDKERWEAEIVNFEKVILQVVPGEFKTKKYQQRAQNFLDRISNLITEFK